MKSVNSGVDQIAIAVLSACVVKIPLEPITRSPQKSPLLHLPEDLLLHVRAHLGKEQYESVPFVCHQFQKEESNGRAKELGLLYRALAHKHPKISPFLPLVFPDFRTMHHHLLRAIDDEGLQRHPPVRSKDRTLFDHRYYLDFCGLVNLERLFAPPWAFWEHCGWRRIASALGGTPPVSPAIDYYHPEQAVTTWVQIPQNQRSMRQVTHLDLSGAPRIPLPYLGFFQNLSVLSLSGAVRHGFLPDGFFRPLIHLQSLDLSHNALQSLPDLTQNLALRELDLSHNQFVLFPIFPHLPRLTRVTLSHNDIGRYDYGNPEGKRHQLKWKNLYDIQWKRDHAWITSKKWGNRFEVNLQNNYCTRWRGIQSTGDYCLDTLENNFKILALLFCCSILFYTFYQTKRWHGLPL